MSMHPPSTPLLSTAGTDISVSAIELEKARGSTKAGAIFGTTSSTTLPELIPLIAPQQAVTRQSNEARKDVAVAGDEYDKLTGSAKDIPSAPVYAARLNGLLKQLVAAEGVVQECVKARTELISALEKMLAANQEELEIEKTQLDELESRKKTIDKKKQDVEFAIMSGLALQENSQARGDGLAANQEPDRPEVEALTPPSVPDEPDAADIEPLTPQAVPPPAVPQQGAFPPSAPGIEMLSTVASHYQAVPVSTNGAKKRRRVDADDEFPDLGNDDGIDADVAEMLRKDSLGT